MENTICICKAKGESPLYSSKEILNEKGKKIGAKIYTKISDNNPLKNINKEGIYRICNICGYKRKHTENKSSQEVQK